MAEGGEGRYRMAAVPSILGGGVTALAYHRHLVREGVVGRGSPCRKESGDLIPT